jgi:hypothetical protein
MSDHQLGDAFRKRTEGVDPVPPSWQEIEDRSTQVTSRRRFTPAVISSIAVAAVVLIVAAAVIFRPTPKGSTHVATQPGETTTSSDETTTTSTVASFPVIDPASVHGVYPFATQAELDAYEAGTSKGFADPRSVAWSFTHKFLDMPNGVTAPFKPKADTIRTIGTVAIRPDAASSQLTTLVLQKVAEDAWTVTGATTHDIQVDQPTNGTDISSPVHVSGQSTAFEATITVDVRTAGSKAANLGTKAVMGGSNGQMGPFSDDVSYTAPAQTTRGVIVFSIISAKDGSTAAATVVGVGFRT